MRPLLLLVAVATALGGAAHAAEVRVLTSGAFKAALLAMEPQLEQETGDTLRIENATAGLVAQKVRSGEAGDLVILPPANAEGLGALLGKVQPLAKVGIGVAVKTGDTLPDIATQEALRATVLAARAPSWIDPAAGGSSGIYINHLFEQWGIMPQLAPKIVLSEGGLVTDLLLDGCSDLAFQQLSELTGHPGVTVVGPLPPSIQSYTVYAGAVPASSAQPQAAAQVLAWLAGPHAAPILHAKGMQTP